MKSLKKCLLLVGLALLTAVSVSANDIEVLRERLLEKSKVKTKIDDANIQGLIESFSTKDSIWMDLNYVDTSRTGFQHIIHLDRVVAIAKAYQTPSSKWNQSKDARGVIDTALEFWFVHDFIGANWWNNEIGTPSQMIDLLYILNDKLSAEQEENIIRIASRAHMQAWGARQSGDRIKIAGLEAKRHIYTRNNEKAREVINIIANEMAVRNRERGVQSDYSFHHRVDRVNNTLSYGQNFVNVFSEWAKLISGTSFKFSEASLKVAVDYYLDGVCKQMVYGRIPSPGIKNRDISRPVEEGVMGTTTPKALLLATSYRADELKAIIKARTSDNYTPSSFAKFYWETEHFAFQRPNYYTSVRMFSTRNASMEVPYNGEGLRNHYRADGTNYLSHNGLEHTAITPYNDWQKIPGTTVLQTAEMPDPNKIQKYGKKTFVGGVDDGLYGAVGLDFLSPLSKIEAKKSWFFFDEEYVCLGAGITSNSANDLVTTLDQVQLDGKVTIKTKNKTSKLKSHTCSNDKNLVWAHHNNIGYYLPEGQNVYVSNQEQVGSWRQVSIQSTTPKDEVRGDVFKMWIDHGTNTVDQSYSYIVLPYITLKDMKNKKIDYIDIISNDAKVQAVRHNKLGILYVVFYEAGTVDTGKGSSITVDQPCIVMVKYGKKDAIDAMYVSDPNRDKKSVTIKVVGGKQTRSFTTELPQGDFSGSTAKVNLAK